MEELFTTLIGKTTIYQSKIITIVADNFSLFEDQARFLKATLAIPEVKRLLLRGDSVKLIQIGPLPIEVEEQVVKSKWHIDRLDQFSDDVYDKIEQSLADIPLVFLNDASRLELSSSDPKELEKLLTLICKFRKNHSRFCVVLYQNSAPNNQSKFLRNLMYISDGVSRVQSCKAGYFTSIWYQKDASKCMALLPMKVETYYYTFKIGKFYWTKDFLCFYETKQVPKNYDLENDTYLEAPEESDMDDEENSIDELNDSMRGSKLSDHQSERDPTKPYTAAQDPQKSKIFYYPDKEDDIDEDDPDNDLMI